ncbi:DNA-binding IclR family transcriptional regulator [Breznakia sp. PF5-3]|uniref:IclR family transcriptional regulator n=1 Tax=unclassified Breznakia TaxID=2623764 RepID=UPI0024058503|nr:MULTISPECIES: IclR family transcriptional regulator [unclassified Breznakia]MDL2276212.1 IclR family transcriptional regulator [Breznakia sp. OttesenSCG-928-G09]MDF9825042.1 DNA-binding IclR family transcriptional regulator [Breznakia sp. PM6-1]MDF9835889.1 DNA-binding IclR family transcriptional regulator [Breznakia sp. PF5-3]MDF9837350.1 DNA-binding IclR family transcriptional regulator [Breznakia sp. PFB2-8]MDF9859285.1 DNA-binding IclR family transcriptional regulator [Breznakia sp. PH5
MKETIEGKNNIKSIVKASKIIDVIAFERSSLSLSELSERLGIAKSTLHGLLSTLVNIRYLEQDQNTGKYKLGVQLFELGSQIANTWNEKAIAKPYMEKLVEETGETIHLAMLSNGEVLYVDKQEANSSIRIATAPGAKLPLHCTGVGKVLLAFSNEKEIHNILNSYELTKYTEHTIIDEEGIKRELNKIKTLGYAYDNQEFLDGLRCVAAPIFDHNHRVIFSLSISGPLSRMKDEVIDHYRDLLLTASQEISRKLGYRK